MAYERLLKHLGDLGVYLVGLGGLEPPTSSLSGKRSNRLSYRPGACQCGLHTAPPG
jgi:hypothetical protein